MIEAMLPLKPDELSKTNLETTAAKPVTAELRPRLVTPEAKTNAAEMLRSRLTALQQEQAKLADDLEKHNRIKLDRLSFDYGGEITRYQNALQALEQGDTSQAIQLVEKQVVANMKSQEDLIQYQQKATTDYNDTLKHIKSAESKLKVAPWDKLKYSNLANIRKSYEMYAAKDIDKAHPDWRKSRDAQVQAARKAEIQRETNLRMISTPEAAAFYADIAADTPQNARKGIKDVDLYAWLQLEKYHALENYRGTIGHVVNSHEAYEGDNTHLDSLIENLGGPRQYDTDRMQKRQTMLNEFKAQTATDPDVRYNQIMENTNASFDYAERQLLNTYNQLAEERSAIGSASQSNLSPEERKLLNLRRSREALLEYRLQQVWGVHMERRIAAGKPDGFPYPDATFADRAAYLRKQEMEKASGVNV